MGMMCYVDGATLDFMERCARMNEEIAEDPDCIVGHIGVAAWKEMEKIDKTDVIPDWLEKVDE